MPWFMSSAHLLCLRGSRHAYFRDSSSRRNSAMQQQPQQGIGGDLAFSPIQGIGIGASSSSAAAGVESTFAAEQMAYEDAWKASNTDFTTPFASIEDAITRCADLEPPVCAASPRSRSASLRHRRRRRQRRVQRARARRSRWRTKTLGIRTPFSSIKDAITRFSCTQLRNYIIKWIKTTLN
ncbi:uncharacterized protein [Lolium perenne]|uniref:uncharacterized protein isoform X1 n=1 Tax=Lolium perenne TaxID=4522 RepID=UPI0021F62F9D|nr:uncharacterized protein LOC127321549 isoform X2 [Lolium perenne]